MLDVARRRAGDRGITNVEFRVMDAEHLDPGTASVDGVLCRFGYMLMADPAAALAETHRVLRPGGRLALAVWAAPERNPFFTVIAAALAAHVTRPPDGVPNPFSMASPDRTRSLLQAAGFDAVTVDEIPLAFPLPRRRRLPRFHGRHRRSTRRRAPAAVRPRPRGARSAARTRPCGLRDRRRLHDPRSNSTGRT
jgi:SAM-dependent methyltransferase